MEGLIADDWLQLWRDAGYTVTLGPDRGWRVRSALLTAEPLDVQPLSPDDHPNLTYHGSYLAAARWQNAPSGPTVLVSVHASPNPAEPEKYGWQGDLPEPRDGGGDSRFPGRRLWDSDLVLDTLRRLSEGGAVPLVAAGDYNEAMAYDFEPDSKTRLGTWGEEYYELAEAAGLSDWLYDTWQEERPTRGGLQLDRVLASPLGASLLAASPEPHLDAGWGPAAPDHLSDHAPVWFALRDQSSGGDPSS